MTKKQVKQGDKNATSNIVTNRLANETSTYLQQHCQNPVDWYPWGDEALKLSRQENKPILLSIGYAACHWCHVMAHESFEDQETAELMNALFVNIKVDREERTDLDEIYMKAIQLMTGHGGWPMTVFLTPECKPFFGGTYFPVNDHHGLPGFKRVLKNVAAAWQTSNTQILDSASELSNHLKLMERIKSDKPEAESESKMGFASVANTNTINAALEKLQRNFDSDFGGFGGAPKFPHSMSLELAMRACAKSSSFSDSRKEECLELVQVTLDKMAYGGIHDQIGGGFARYSVDRHWLVPHFEKMLYDNALLAKTYIDGYLLTGREYWLRVAEGILKFVSRELTTKQGAFYSSLDADSEGEEGKFYVWRPEQIVEVLGEEEGTWFNQVFGITERGNFEHKTSILHLSKSPEELSRQYTTPLDKLWQTVDSAAAKLLAERAKRIRPTRDEKVLTSWNSLMITAFIEGYKATAKQEYLQSALEAANFILDNLKVNDRLMRVWGMPVNGLDTEGIVKLKGCLDDYAYFIEALLNIASVDGDEKWLNTAEQLCQSMIKYFRDEDEGGFFFTASDHEELVVRPRSHYDGSVPSGTSVATSVLLKLAKLTGKAEYLNLAEEIFSLYGPHFSRMPDQFANLLSCLDMYLFNGPEVAIALSHDDDRDMLLALHQKYYPNKVVAVASEKSDLNFLKDKKVLEKKTTVYICQNFTCDKPVNNLSDLKARLSGW
ncbi:thioredoxin domain-containing protein [bacterium]|nr:thioredoxin domain-containing protein [bacterium]MBP9809282.1 thioredoxin domain-containing protein [bacterium]